MAFVAVLMGSASDWSRMETTTELLRDFEIEFEVRVCSAHRTPIQTIDYVHDADSRGCAVFVCAAGLAAALAGTVAAHTTKPVIGVPIDAGSLSGIDALLSTVQMPGGIPVAAVAIGSAGAKNAAYLAAQILALSDNELASRLESERQENRKKINDQNQQVQQSLTNQ